MGGGGGTRLLRGEAEEHLSESYARYAKAKPSYEGSGGLGLDGASFDVSSVWGGIDSRFFPFFPRASAASRSLEANPHWELFVNQALFFGGKPTSELHF